MYSMSSDSLLAFFVGLYLMLIGVHCRRVGDQHEQQSPSHSSYISKNTRIAFRELHESEQMQTTT
jgi:hypothetical protein